MMCVCVWTHVKAFSPCCVYRAVDDHVTMSLLHCESGCGPSQSESDCCAAMAASSCGTAAKDDSVSGAASAVTLSSSFMEEIQGYDVEFDPPPGEQVRVSHLLDGFAGSGADTLRPQVLQSLHHQIHKVREHKEWTKCCNNQMEHYYTE